MASAAHVLVVDDAPELRTLFRDALGDEGYRVTLAAAAPSLAEVRALRPDAVVLDLLLGQDEGDAWALLRGLRADPELRAVPVLVCSAATHLLRRLEPELRDLGAEVVPKPFDLGDFLAALDRCVRRGGDGPTEGEAPGP